MRQARRKKVEGGKGDKERSKWELGGGGGGGGDQG